MASSLPIHGLKFCMHSHMRATCPSNPILIDLMKSKFTITQFSRPVRYFLSFRTKHSSQHFFNSLNVCTFLHGNTPCFTLIKYGTKKSHRSHFKDQAVKEEEWLTVEDGTDRLSGNIGN
jgi:hypothetical protein